MVTPLMVGITFATLMVAGCSDATNVPPNPAAKAIATYDLATVGESSLPIWYASLVSNPAVPGIGGKSLICDDSLTASAVTLSSDKSFKQNDRLRIYCDDGRPPADSLVEYPGQYSTLNGSIDLVFPGPSPYWSEEIGTVDSTSMVIALRKRASNTNTTTLVYGRRPEQ